MGFPWHPRRWSLSVWVFIFCVLFSIAALGLGHIRSYIAAAVNPSFMSALQSCARDANGSTALIACAHQVVKVQLEQHSPRELMNEISANTVTSSYGDCHSIAHVIGEETYAKYNVIEQALSYCSNQCFSGCLHGVLGAAMVQKLGIQDPDTDISHMDAGQIETIGGKYCKNISDLEICHGIGHILFAVLGDFKKASHSCSVITSQGLFLDECVTGVYMQGVGGVADTLVLGKTVPSDADVPDGDYGYPCDAIAATDEQYRHSCFKYLVPYQEILFAKNNIQDANEKLGISTHECETLSMPDRSYCFEGVGRYIPFFIPRSGTATEGILNICANLPKESDKESCILGHVRILRSYSRDGRALAYCAAMSPKELQDSCFFSYFSYYGLDFKRTADHACLYSTAKELCKQEFNAYDKVRLTLRDTIYYSQ